MTYKMLEISYLKKKRKQCCNYKQTWKKYLYKNKFFRNISFTSDVNLEEPITWVYYIDGRIVAH